MRTKIRSTESNLDQEYREMRTKIKSTEKQKESEQDHENREAEPDHDQEYRKTERVRGQRVRAGQQSGVQPARTT